MTFVLGTQKSGTTWLQNILGNHLKFRQEAEWNLPGYFDLVVRHLNNHHRGSVSERYGIVSRTVRAGWHAMVTSVGGDSFFDDKTAYPALPIAGARPDLYPYAIDICRLHCDEAKFVLIVRDPRDVLVSSIWHWETLRTSLGPAEVSFFAHNWAKCNVHWRNSSPNVIVRYEDLKVDFVNTVRRIFSCLNLDLSPEDEGKISEEYAGLEKSRSRDPLFYRKGIVGEWKSELAADHANLIWSAAGIPMAQFGYSEKGVESNFCEETFWDLPLSEIADDSFNRDAGHCTGRVSGLRFFIFRNDFSMKLVRGQFPSLQSSQNQLLIGLTVSWRNPIECGGKRFGYQTSDGRDFLCEVEDCAVITRAICDIFFLIDHTYTNFDTLTLKLFNGNVHSPFHATLHRVRLGIVPRGSRVHEQYGDGVLKGSGALVNNDALYYALNGWSPLHFAANSGNHEDLQELLLRGESANVEEFNGATPLHRAADFDHCLCAELLLRYGANANAIDRNRKETPLDIALRKKHDNVAALLKSHGGYRFIQLYGDAPSDLPKSFDSEQYLQANPDVRVAGVDAAIHFMTYGRFEGRRLWPRLLIQPAETNYSPEV